MVVWNGCNSSWMLQEGTRLMTQTLGALSSPCPFLAFYCSWGCKTDPEVQVCQRLGVAKGQNCHRGMCACPLPPWDAA